MKKYNIQNYNRYKKEVEKLMPEGKFWDEYTRDELVIKFLPLVENIARKFSTSQQASGVLSINDLIQEGNLALVKAADRIEWDKITTSEHPEKTIKSFLSKRIKGAIRRAIDINRGNIKIPEYKLIEIRAEENENDKVVQMFFNSVFLSFDQKNRIGQDVFSIEDKTEKYSDHLLNSYLLSLMKKYLTNKEYNVLRMSYGLDCEKMQAKEIANKLNINNNSSQVRVSQIKRDAINKLISNVNKSQVIDFL